LKAQACGPLLKLQALLQCNTAIHKQAYVSEAPCGITQTAASETASAQHLESTEVQPEHGLHSYL
jgi:hypothetical protein